MSIVIVYAPQGAGKTRHSEALRKHYGCNRVVDDSAPGQPLRAGDLALTNEVGAVRFVSKRIAVVTLDDALADMEGENHG